MDGALYIPLRKTSHILHMVCCSWEINAGFLILLCDVFFQDSPPVLQAILTGEISISSAKDSHRQGQRERALALLHQMIEDAHMGKRQFLSGTFSLLGSSGKRDPTHYFTGVAVVLLMFTAVNVFLWFSCVLVLLNLR